LVRPSFQGIRQVFDGYDAGQFDNLFDLYKPWRDGYKVGFNRVDLDKAAAWLGERAG
jgi:hypothetical protein